jgi:DNA replication and repair protein RecF
VALSSISLRGFRNLEATTIEFDSATNYVFGPNGAGKTNLLEAIHYLAMGRSFRRCPDMELLGFGRDVLVVSGRDETGAAGEVRFDGREKRVLRSDTPVEKLSEYFGWLPVVVLLLEDIELVRGAPAVRRGYLDMAVAKAETQAKSEVRSQNAEGRGVERSYIELMGEYRRAVGQYNRLLEKYSAFSAQHSALEELGVWEEELVRTGVPVYERRMELVGPLLEGASRYYERLAGETAEFAYRSSIARTGDSPPERSARGTVPIFADAFRERLTATRKRAQQFGHVLVGPHRDDIRVTRGTRELRRFGSVGEQRLAGIALRLAEADMLLSAGRQRPVFLLDEVASELDERRSRLVLSMVAERGQMVYAAARRIAPQVQSPKSKGQREEAEQADAVAVRDAASLDPLTPGPLDPFLGKEFHVEAGTISEVP